MFSSPFFSSNCVKGGRKYEISLDLTLPIFYSIQPQQDCTIYHEYSSLLKTLLSRIPILMYAKQILFNSNFIYYTNTLLLWEL